MIDFLKASWPELLFVGIFAYMIFSVVKNGGIKNALFGAKQKYKVGEVIGRKRRIMSSSIAVHVMTDTESGEEIVGLELIQKALMSYSMQPLTLEKSDALKLAELLNKAAGKTQKS